MSHRLRLPLVLLALTLPFAACGSDDAPGRTGDGGTPDVATLDTHCPQGPTTLAEAPLDDVVRVGDAMYASATSGILRVDGEDQTKVYDAPERRLEMLASFDGDLVVTADVARPDHTPHLLRVTPEGTVVWDVELPEDESVDLQDPDAIVEVGADRHIDLRTGEDVDYDGPTLSDLILSRGGIDYVLADRSGDLRLYNDLQYRVLLTDDDQDTIKELSGSATLCGDRLYALDRALDTLTTYRIDGDDLDEVTSVELPEPATQTYLSTIEGALRVEIDGTTWLATD